MTSPFLASTSIIAFDDSLSAWSLPFTIVFSISSSVEPVGAPTPASLVRTIVTPWSRSRCNSPLLRRHSEMRLVMSMLPVAPGLVLNAPVAPVVLVDELVAPMVLLLDVSELLVPAVALGLLEESDVSEDVVLEGLVVEDERPALLLAGVEL
jgi:hypothetical protein